MRLTGNLLANELQNRLWQSSNSLFSASTIFLMENGMPGSWLRETADYFFAANCTWSPKAFPKTTLLTTTWWSKVFRRLRVTDALGQPSIVHRRITNVTAVHRLAAPTKIWNLAFGRFGLSTIYLMQVRQCFLSHFWVSKRHPIILQWHPKFCKPGYGFALYWSKTIWGKHAFLHVAIATDGCNVIDRHIFLAQKLEAKTVSLVSVHCHAHRRASASYCTAAYLYSMVYATAKALSCNYGNVLLFHRCDRLAWRCIRPQWRQKVGSCSARANQGGCQVRQQWELGVRF